MSGAVIFAQVYGGQALPDFRIHKLLAVCRQSAPRLEAMEAWRVYFIAWRQSPRKQARERLWSLLETRELPVITRDTLCLWVLPRPGTRPPWSSKAADIFAGCGLHAEVRAGVEWRLRFSGGQTPEDFSALAGHLYDRMTEVAVCKPVNAANLFTPLKASALKHFPLLATGQAALEEAGKALGFQLAGGEVAALLDHYRRVGRDPTDAELMMYAQFHSEHCRHKTFNARWWLDGKPCEHSPFNWIRSTSADATRLLSAYRDNAAVLKGYTTPYLQVNADNRYIEQTGVVNLIMKVETHNHPTAISPYAGAATGAGGEIRDEVATGRGAKPRAGLAGFTTSDLHVPDFIQPWEQPTRSRPLHLAKPLTIMLEAPLGAADYNNEFGRPALGGYFRTYEHGSGNFRLGYDKPIMLAGGMGTVRDMHVHKLIPRPGDLLVLLGGPAMRIGVGGGSASSRISGQGDEELDFSSVQRDNAQMQRRCQEVIDHCRSLGVDNPIRTIHDVGAGGLANAVPESLAGMGAVVRLGDVPSDDPSLSPMELWCNEAQERYVLIIGPADVECFAAACRHERAPYAVIGEVRASAELSVEDAKGPVVHVPMELLCTEHAPLEIYARRGPASPYVSSTAALAKEAMPSFDELARRVLRLPAVADKGFLITIGDRSVSGRVRRDPLVGPWQVAVSDCAVTGEFRSLVGQAMAIGERTPIARLNAPASGRMAVTEALTNLCAARVVELADVALSANWMAVAGRSAEKDGELYETVAAVSGFCRSLGVSIPVGKDSLSMRTQWQHEGKEQAVEAPLSLVVTAFARVIDTGCTLTPQLHKGDTRLILVDLGRGNDRLGGSACEQVLGNRTLGVPPDMENPADLVGFFRSVQLLNEAGYLLAYHDRADGGLFVSLCEMAFAARVGLDVQLPENCNPLARLYTEEAGAVLQVPADAVDTVLEHLRSALGEPLAAADIGAPMENKRCLQVSHRGTVIFTADLQELQRCWAETGYRIRALRDDPGCAREEYDRLLDSNDKGLWVRCHEKDAAPAVGPALTSGGPVPCVAVLREQGVNSHEEMAAAFTRVGFECVDVHTADLIEGRISLREFAGLAACGGFSYGDVLGAGGGWATVIQHHEQLRHEFGAFFARPDTFTLGVCNGCQMLSRLTELVPGSGHWPRFLPNRSRRFESRLVMVEVLDSPSVLLAGMSGWQLPVVVAHGEGRAAREAPLACLRYVEADGSAAERHPRNPNGSPGGLTAFTSADGRVTIMMPHPERCFLNAQYSFRPPGLHGEESPWMYLFQNAWHWVARNAR